MYQILHRHAHRTNNSIIPGCIASRFMAWQSIDFTTPRSAASTYKNRAESGRPLSRLQDMSYCRWYRQGRSSSTGSTWKGACCWQGLPNIWRTSAGQYQEASSPLPPCRQVVYALWMIVTVVLLLFRQRSECWPAWSYVCPLLQYWLLALKKQLAEYLYQSRRSEVFGGGTVRTRGCTQCQMYET